MRLFVEIENVFKILIIFNEISWNPIIHFWRISNNSFQILNYTSCKVKIKTLYLKLVELSENIAKFYLVNINFYGFEFNSTYFFGGHSNLVIFVEFVGKICLKTTFNKTLFCNVPYLSPPSSIFVSNYVSNCKRYLHETQMNVLLTVTIRYNTQV